MLVQFYEEKIAFGGLGRNEAKKRGGQLGRQCTTPKRFALPAQLATSLLSGYLLLSQ
jgi:hypothetical protein